METNGLRGINMDGRLGKGALLSGNQVNKLPRPLRVEGTTIRLNLPQAVGVL